MFVFGMQRRSPFGPGPSSDKRGRRKRHMGKSNTIMPPPSPRAALDGAKTIREQVQTTHRLGGWQADETWLVLPVGPSINDKYVSRTFVTSKAWKEYKETVKWMAIDQKAKPFKGPVEVRLKWYRAQKKGDIDSKVKCLLDALEGVCYENDSQIEKLVVERSDANSKTPCIVVRVRPS